MSILKTESYKKGIVLSVGLNLLAKGMAFVTSLALARYFGTSAGMDVYLYAFLTVGLVVGFVSSLNSSVIIPEAMRLHEQEGPEAGAAFVNFFLYAYAAAGALLVLAALLDPVRLFLAFSRFDGELLRANAVLLYWAVPLFLLTLIASYLVDVLASKKFFVLPTAASILTNVCALACVLLLHGKLGVASVLAGLTAAYALQVVFLLGLLRYSLRWDFRFRFLRLRAAVRHNIVFSQLGNLTSSLYNYVPLLLLSGLGAGTLSAMNYGRQAADFPNNFITLQFSSVAGIKLNELSARKMSGELGRVFTASAKLLLFLLVPVSCAGFFFSADIIDALFRRGVFDARSAEAAAGFFRLFILLLPFSAVNTLVSRLFLAEQKVREAFWYQAGMNLALVGLIVLGVRRYGALGYPAALLALYAANFFLSRYLLRHYFREVGYDEVMLYFAKTAALDLALLAPFVLLAGAIPGVNVFLRLGAACGLYFTLLLLLAWKFGHNRDMQELLGALRSRFFAGTPAGRTP